MVKIDIRKAYDSVEWIFLQMVLIEFGFPMKMVNWIMTCVSTVSYTLLINGGLTTRFQAKKGLRQGDSMSSYLFVLSMEYLNRSLKKLNANLDSNYHPRCSKLNLIHICFTDDLLLCCRADKISILLMLQAFNHFSEVSGLKANMEKSSLHIAGVSNEFKQQIIQEMGFATGEIPFRYLSVPLSSRKITVHQCLPLVEKMITRLLPRLWVKWIHYFYIKQKTISDCHIPKQASWLVWKILEFQKVEWKKVVLVQTIIPRHQFILWLAIQNRLATVDRLQKWGIQVDKRCILCTTGRDETLEHMLFECTYSQHMWKSILSWLSIQRRIGNWQEEVQWVASKVSTRPWTHILGFLFAATVYHIWGERNARRF
ncbi:uncharacterized protein LOC142180987 [Nicotiana tabacum]|uniref:Uncharacterized protein LOC142180987 n=1 Tax=Nicotiana tabacum TaxID=4097 RepID=A0AC58UI77_TOBAC